MFGYFYHSQLRTYALLMANLFNNISIKRHDNLIKVPITYGSKEAFYMKINSLLQKPVGQDTKLGIETILPRMNVQLIDIIYDGQAKTATNHNAITMTNNGKYRKQYNMCPMKITYELNIQAKNQDDMYQILEQIFPYFTPYFIQEIRETFSNKGEDIIVAHKVPIEIIGISPDEQQVAGPNERRRLEWQIQFSLRGYLYPPNVDLGNVIKTVYLDFRSSKKGYENNFEQLDFQIQPIEATIYDWDNEILTSTSKNEEIDITSNSIRGSNKKKVKLE